MKNVTLSPHVYQHFTTKFTVTNDKRFAIQNIIDNVFNWRR